MQHYRLLIVEADSDGEVLSDSPSVRGGIEREERETSDGLARENFVL